MQITCLKATEILIFSFNRLFNITLTFAKSWPKALEPHSHKKTEEICTFYVELNKKNVYYH